MGEDKRVWVNPDATNIVLRIRQTYAPIVDMVDMADTHPVISAIDSGGRHASTPAFQVPSPGQEFWNRPELRTQVPNPRKRLQCQICHAEPVSASFARMDHPAYRFLGDHCRAHFTELAEPMARFLRFPLRAVLDAVMARCHFETEE